MSGNSAAKADEIEWAPSPERQALAEALRRLLDVAVETGAGPEQLGAAAAAIDGVTSSLAGTVIRPDFSVQPNSYRSHMSLVGGLSHPIAPQLHMDVEGDSGSGVVVVSRLYQGGPGLCHGGVIALLVDHAMGCVANQADRPAMTVRLTLRYRRPTPIEVPLTVSVRIDRIDRRQVHLSATVATPDEVTVEAEGVFLVLTTENLGAVFGSR
jgi:acyl-coenzyme A thioesterase PaaI-like protein